MDKIPTIEDLFKKYSNLYQFEEGSSEYLIDKEDFRSSIIEFAKLHVKAALEEAAEKADTYWDGNPYDPENGSIAIDRDTIRNAYPEENIK